MMEPFASKKVSSGGGFYSVMAADPICTYAAARNLDACIDHFLFLARIVWFFTLQTHPNRLVPRIYGRLFKKRRQVRKGGVCVLAAVVDVGVMQ